MGAAVFGVLRCRRCVASGMRACRGLGDLFWGGRLFRLQGSYAGLCMRFGVDGEFSRSALFLLPGGVIE